MWQAGPVGSTRATIASPSQSIRSWRSLSTCPDSSPFRQILPRERLKKCTSPLSTVSRSASPLAYASVSTSPLSGPVPSPDQATLVELDRFEHRTIVCEAGPGEKP